MFLRSRSLVISWGDRILRPGISVSAMCAGHLQVSVRAFPPATLMAARIYVRVPSCGAVSSVIAMTSWANSPTAPFITSWRTCCDLLIGLDYFSLRSSQHQAPCLVTSERGRLARGEKAWCGNGTITAFADRWPVLVGWLLLALPFIRRRSHVVRAPRAFGLCRQSLSPWHPE
jgi:hypothetical protein